MSRLAITIEGYTFEVEVSGLPVSGAGNQVLVDGQAVTVTIPDIESLQGGLAWVLISDRPYEVELDPELQWMHSRWGMHVLEVQDLDMKLARPHTGDGRIKAPIPGQIARVLVTVGERVEAGQPLLVLEAMKMENEIHAPRSGVVESLNVKPGQGVALHDLLAEVG